MGACKKYYEVILVDPSHKVILTILVLTGLLILYTSIVNAVVLQAQDARVVDCARSPMVSLEEVIVLPGSGETLCVSSVIVKLYLLLSSWCCCFNISIKTSLESLCCSL